MRTSRVHRSLRVLIGGLAAALGIGSIPVQAVIAGADAPSDDHTRAIEPESLPAPGTYESCTAMFGLYKSNSDLATFDIAETGTPLVPVPVMGTDIVPLVTVTDSTQATHTCVAVPGWTDEATFSSDYLRDSSVLFSTSMPYPGTGYYLLPATTSFDLVLDGGSSITPVSRQVVYANAIPGAWSLTASPSQPPTLRSHFDPMNFARSASDLDDPFFTRVFAAVAAAGTQAQADLLRAQALDAVNNVVPIRCDDTDPLVIATAATLQPMLAGTWLEIAAIDCPTLVAATVAIGNVLQFRLQVHDAPVTLTVAGPEPTTTTAPVEPVAPAFTG